MQAFFIELGKLLGWFGEVTGHMERVQRLGPFLVLMLGPAAWGAVSAGWFQIIDPYVPYLLALTGAIAIWACSVAWERSEGPIIWVGEPDVEGG
jgi:hypothetical protein